MAASRNKAVRALVDPMQGRVGYQLRRVSVAMMADLGARLAPLGLRPTEATILLLVGANAGCRQGEVGAALGIAPANMVALVARLVELGLVDRGHADGRTHALSLTSRGVARVAAINKVLDRQEAGLQGLLQPRESSALLGSLRKLRGEGVK